MVMNRYIQELIATEELVCLPELGGFISKHVSAHLDPSTHIFSPPQKQLAFNERLNEDGGKLSRFIQEAEKISSREAAEKISDFVAEIKTALDKNDEYSIKGIGYFFKDEDGNTTFNPSLDPKADPINFGLPQILVKHQPDNHSNKDFLQKPKDRKAMSTQDLPSVPEPLMEGESALPDHESSNAPKKKAANLTWLYIITPLVLFGGLGTFLGVTDDGRKMLSSMHIVSTEPIEADSTTNELESATEGDLAEASAENTENTATESFEDAVSAEETIKKTENEAWGEAPVKSQQEDIAKNEDVEVATANLITGKSGRFFIIVGGFSNKKNAVKMREKLIHDGLEAKVIAPAEGGTLYRVSLGDYSNHAEATTQVKSLRGEHGDALWVMEY